MPYFALIIMFYHVKIACYHNVVMMGKFQRFLGREACIIKVLPLSIIS